MKRYQIGAWSAFLATRERGRQVREDVEEHLEKVPPGRPLILDFSGVKGITASFGDELLAKLVVSRGPGDQASCGIVVEGACDEVREILERALARRKVPAPAMRRLGRGSSVSRRRVCHLLQAALGSRVGAAS